VISPTFVLRRDYELEPSLIPNPSPLEKGAMRRMRTSDIRNYEGLKLKAKEMRVRPTSAETALWNSLRGNNFKIRFRRQHIIDNFIVDFVNLENKLVIEIDGDIHDLQKEKDQERTRVLEKLGFKVLRFTNNQVVNELGMVLEKVSKFIVLLSNGEGLGVRRIIHIDAYRLEKPEDIFQVIGKEELNDKRNLIIIEWPEKIIRDGLPPSPNFFDDIYEFSHVDEVTRKINRKNK
jgi:very-short-patch-repair endonuclease